MTTFAIGVDLGGTNLRIAAVDNSGKILEKITTGTAVARGRDRVIDEMCACVKTLALKHRAASELAGIGVGVPGIIDMERGMVRASPNLPGWEDYPVRDEIERRLATAVMLENDANAAALGEKWLGAAAAVDDMCMLTLGTGVGGGLVLHGRVWHGMTGMAAELGHINVEPEGRACNCGSRGCLEQYASATAVKQDGAGGHCQRESAGAGEGDESRSRIQFQGRPSHGFTGRRAGAGDFPPRGHVAGNRFG